MRVKIFNWIKANKTYAQIIKLVGKEGFKISKGGISFIKDKMEQKESTEQNNQNSTERTEQKNNESRLPKKIENNKITKSEPSEPILTNDELNKNQLKTDKKTEIVYVRLLSDLEFKTFKSSLLTITKSNYKRLKSNRATGILNALNLINATLEIIEKRGKYKK